MINRKILITGATGGLGLALTREALARGHEVRAVGRSRDAGITLTKMGASFVSCDLTHAGVDLRELVRGCDSAIHAAALSASWGERTAFETSNVRMTERLLEACAAEAVERFVFVSSPSIFAGFEDRTNIAEEALPNAKPLNHYARTKLAAEQAVLAIRKDDMACLAIRPRALVGRGDQVILPRLAELARRKRVPLPGGGKALIELTDLRDAAWAICEAEERADTLSGKAINISGGRPIAVRELALRLAEAIGTTPKLISLPLGLARGVAAALEQAARLTRSSHEPMLTRYTLATLAYSQTFDQEPAQRLLGFAPRYDATETVLAEARRLAAAGAAA